MMAMRSENTHDLVKVVAHDLKSPIGAVKGYIDLLRQVGPLNERQQHFVTRALEGLGYMEHLIANFIEYARLGSGTQVDFVNCDLHALVREALDLLEGQMLKRDLTLHLDMNSASAPVMGDPRLLAQVMHNLLSNAVKYNREHGAIHVTIEREHDFVRIGVRDTGMGIAPDELPHIFDQFYRSPSSAEHQIEGSGLGLAIVKMIIEHHQGHLRVESALGQGSLFTVILPRRAKSGESDEHYRDLPSRHTERFEGTSATHREHASEESDAVDDNLQESVETSQGDSRSDDR
jgi:signal transduction histidine kinase